MDTSSSATQDTLPPIMDSTPDPMHPLLVKVQYQENFIEIKDIHQKDT